MTAEERTLTDEQVKEVVKKFIIRLQECIIVKKGGQFYGWIHRIAKESGYIEEFDSKKLDTLKRADILKCVEQMWNYAVDGILAPGSLKDITGSMDDIFFPYFHLTEKGKKMAKGWQSDNTIESL